MDKDWRGICEGRAGGSHMALLSALETMSFFEASFPFFWSKLPWLLLGVYIHSIGVFGGGIPGGGGGVECNGGSG